MGDTVSPYVIDFDKIKTIDDIKAIIKALKLEAKIPASDIKGIEHLLYKE